jgi:hypothetical protein
MPIPRHRFQYIFIAIFSALLFVGSSPVALAQTVTDTTTVHDSTVKPKTKYLEKSGHQLCFAYDITRPIISAVYSDRQDAGFAVDYYLRKEVYLVAEGGWGGSEVNYDFLKYNTKNNYVTFGINKSLLKRTSSKDWDMAFMGVRLGFADIQRSSANYQITDTLWSNQIISKSLPGENLLGYWVEVTGGMRVELAKHFFLGWTIRGRFLMSASAFSQLAPLYIAGYGTGDKNSVFDFNFYATYAIRWNRKHE